jgi:hypothetical protein
MSQCQCLTLKGERCKNSVGKSGNRFCGRHLNCTNIYASAASPSSSASASSLVSNLTRSRLPIIAPIPRSGKVTEKASVERGLERDQEVSEKDKRDQGNQGLDIGLKDVKMPTPLINHVTNEIVNRVESGDTAKEATFTTLDNIVEELGYEDVTDLIDLTEEEIDYYISTILLHENKDKLADIVQRKIEEQFIRDPHAKLIIKSRELLQELAAKFCRCIKKVLATDPNNESKAIAICRRGVINGRGLTFPRFSCTNSNFDKVELPIFLPSKENKKLLRRHPGYQHYLSTMGPKGNLSLREWDKLGKLEKDTYLKTK